MHAIAPPPGHRSTRLLEAEEMLRQAGRQLELAGITDPEWDRLARVVFRLAQRVAVDSGRLEAAA